MRKHILTIVFLSSLAALAQTTPLAGEAFVDPDDRNTLVIPFNNTIGVTSSAGFTITINNNTAGISISSVSTNADTLFLTLNTIVGTADNVFIDYASGPGDLTGAGGVASFDEFIFTPLTFPADGDVNIGLAADIVFVFDTAARNADNSAITTADVSAAITVGTSADGNGCPNGGLISYTPLIDDTNYQQIIINPDANLSPSTTYYVELDPAAFELFYDVNPGGGTRIESDPLNDVGCFSFTTRSSSQQEPAFISGTPAVTNQVLQTSFDLVYRLNTASLVYYLVLDNNETSPRPLPQEIEAGVAEEGVFVASGSVLYSPSGGFDTVTVPVSFIDYDVFVVAKSFPDGIYSVVDSIGEVGDSSPPVASYNIAGATGVDPDVTDLIVTFNEEIRKQSGNSTFENTGDLEAALFLTRDSIDGASQAIGTPGFASETTITIDLASLPKDGATYFLRIASGIIQDQSGNNYEGDTISFTLVDEIAPVATIYPPDLTAIDEDTVLNISFSEAVRRTNNSLLNNTNVDALITLKVGDAGGADVAFNAFINSTNDEILVIPTALIPGQDYYFAFTGLEDFSDNAVADGNVTFSVIDDVPPLLTFIPPGGSSNIQSDDTVFFVFSEPVRGIDNSPLSSVLVSLKNSSGTIIPSTATVTAGNDTIFLIPDGGFSSGITYRAVLNEDLEDFSDNLLTRDSVNFSAADTEPPLITSSVQSITNNQVRLNISANETGTVYYALFAGATSNITDPADIINPSSPQDNGTISINSSAVNVNQIQTLSSTGTAGTQVDIYLVMVDGAGNPSTITKYEDLRLGGVNITAPTVDLCLDSDFAAIGSITIQERNAFDFRNTAGEVVSFILSAPAGYAFDPSSGAISGTGADITVAPQVSVASSAVTVTYATNGEATLDQIQITGLRVRNTANNDNVNILRTGGDARILGLSAADAPVLGNLSSLDGPDLPVLSDEVICNGSDVVIGATATPGDAAISTYSWTGPALSDAAIAQPTATPTSTSVYTLTVTDGNGCQAVDELTVTVNPLPMANLVSDDIDDAICFEEPIQFTAFPVSGVSYSYDVDGTVVSTSRIMATDTFTVDHTVTVTITDNATLCENTASISLTVNPLPEVTFFTRDGTFSYPLGGEQDTLVGEVNGSVNSSGLFSGTGVSDSFFIPSLIPVDGTYPVTYTFTDANGCTNDETINFTLFDPASSILISGDPGDPLGSSYCVDFGILPDLDVTADFKSNLPSGYTFLRFALIDGGGSEVTGFISNDDLNTAAVTPGDYTIRYFYQYVVVIGFTPTIIFDAIDVQDITINPLPVPAITTPILSGYCEDNDTNISLTGTGGVSREFDLYYFDGGSYQLQETDINSFNPANLKSTYGLGNYRIFLKSTSVFGCQDSISRDFSIFFQPAAPTIVSDTIKYCFDPGTFASNISVSGTQPTYSWYSDTTNLITNSPSASGSSSAFNPVLELNVLSTTTNRIFVTQTSADGCESEPLPVTVIRYPEVPEPILSDSDVSCQFTSLQTPVEVPSGQGNNQPGDSITWYSFYTRFFQVPINGIANNKAPTNAELGIDTAAAGIYEYYATKLDYFAVDFAGCESDTAIITKQVLAQPTPAPVSDPAPYCDNNSLNSTPIENFTFTGEAGATYRWYVSQLDFNSGKLNSINNPTPSEPGNNFDPDISNDLPDESVRLDTTFYVVKYLYEGTPTLAEGCPSPIDSVRLIINPTPGLPVAADPDPYCNGVGAIDPLLATSDSLNASFNWYEQDPLFNLAEPVLGTSNNSTPFNTGLSNTNPTQVPFFFDYYVTQVHASGCEGPSEQVFVTINPTPLAPTFADADIETCQFLDLTSFQITDGDSSVRWYANPDLSGEITGLADSLNPISFSELAIDSTFSGTTRFYVTQTERGCEGAIREVSYTINPRPADAVISADSAYYCQFLAVPDLQAQSQAGLTYRWYDSNNLSASIGTGATFNPSAAYDPTINQTPGNQYFFVTQTSAAGCESVPDSINLTTFAKPSNPVFASDSLLYCSGQELDTITVAGENIEWYNSSFTFVTAGNQFLPSDNTLISGINDPDRTIIYYATQTTNRFTGFDGCQSDFEPIINQVYRRPALPVDVESFIYCVGDDIDPLTATLNENVDPASIEFEWFIGTDTTLANRVNVIANPNNPTPSEMGILNTLDTTYQFLVRQSRFDCPGNPFSLSVNVFARPSAPSLSSYDSTACNVDDENISISVPGSNVQIYYNAGLTSIKDPFVPGSTFNVFTTGEDAPVNKSQDSSLVYYATQRTNLAVGGGAGCEGPALAIPFRFFKKPDLLTIASVDTICHNPDSADIYTRELIASNAEGDVSWSSSPTFSSNVLDDDTLSLLINNQDNIARTITRYVRQRINGCFSNISSKEIEYLRIAELSLGQDPLDPEAEFDGSYCLDADSISIFAFADDNLINGTSNEGQLFINNVLQSRRKFSPQELGVETQELTLLYVQGQCISKVERNFDINLEPALPFAADPSPTCFDAEAPVINVSGDVGGAITVYNSADLNPGNTTFFSNGVFTADEPENYSRFRDTTFTYFATQTIAGCESSPRQINVIYYRLPEAPQITGVAPICFDQNLQTSDTIIQLSTNLSYDSVEWSTNQNFIASTLLFDEEGYDLADRSEILFTPIRNSNQFREIVYYAREYFRGCVGSFSSDTVVFQDVPELFIGDNHNNDDGGFSQLGYCIGPDTLDLYGFSSTSGSVNLLSPDVTLFLRGERENGVTVDSVLSANFFRIDSLGVGEYEIEFTQNAVGCETRVIESFVINGLPDPQFTIEDGEYCNTADDFPLGSPGEGIDYFIDFSFNAGTPETALIGNRFFPELAVPGLHRLILEEEDDNECKNTDTLVVRINPVPEFALDISSTCSLDTISFAPDFQGTFLDDLNLPLFSSSSVSYNWILGSGLEFDQESIEQKLPSGNRNISLTVTYESETGEQCPTVVNENIDFGAAPEPSFALAGSALDRPGVLIGNTVLDRDDIAIAQWTIGTNTYSLVNEVVDGFNFDLPAPQDLNSVPGRHDVKLVLITKDFCVDSLIRTVYKLPYIGLGDPYQTSFEAGEEGWIPEGRFPGMLRFEVDSASWTAAEPVVRGSSDVISAASDGDRAWITQLNNGKYFTNEVSALNSPVFDFSQTIRPVLIFDQLQNLQPGSDGVAVQASTNDFMWVTLDKADRAKNWYTGTVNSMNTVLVQNPSLLAWSDINTDYQDTRYNLDEFAGERQVRFRFLLTSNDGTENEGFALDNFRIIERNRTAVVENFGNLSESGFTSSVETIEAIRSANFSSNADELITLHYNTDFQKSINTRGSSVQENTRAYFYGISSLPSIVIDGNTSTTAVNNQDFYTNLWSRRILELSPFDIEISYDAQSIDEVTVNVSVTALENARINNDRVVLQTAITEDSVMYQTDTETLLVDGVVRKMLPSPVGIPLPNDWEIGDSFDTTFTWIPENVEKLSATVAMVQNFNTKEVYQSARRPFDNVIENPVGNASDFASIRLYPNPARDMLTLQTPGRLSKTTQWVIFDQVGLILDEGQTEAGALGIQVDLSDIPSGIYFIQLQQDGLSSGVYKFSVVR